MSTKELLSHLRSIGVRLWVEGENLRLNAPKGALSAPLKEELSARKGEILGVLQAAAQAEEGTEIQPVPRDGELLASVAQQRLWFLDRLAPGTPVYNIAAASRIPRLDESAFSKAFDALIERHEVLRTSFEATEDAPRLVIHPPTTGNLEIIDLATTPPEERDTLIGSLVEERAQRGFDLSEAPLVRATLIQVNPQESVLVWCVHHIVADGWSLEIITRDLVVLYTGFQSGQPSPLPELPLQFADFAAWQRERVDSPAVQGQLAYWTNQLGGRLPVMELPTDRPRPPIQTMAGARTRLEVPRALADRLKALSHEEGVTLFMTLLAAFKVFLFRYTGESDVVVGTPTAGRDHPKLENLVGFFVNNLVLRTNLQGTPTFRELLQRVRRVVLDAHANQEVPFDQLVEVLRPERSMAHPPLFQVMFNSPTAPQKNDGRAGGAEEVEFQVGTARFDLTVEVYDHTGSKPTEDGPEPDEKGLTFFFEYNTDLFDRESVADFQTSYRRLLEELVAGIDHPISLLPLLEEEERTRTLEDWNQTGAEYPKDRCFHQLFEDRATEDRSRVAVRAGEESLTYGELDQRAGELAAHLQQMGVGPGSLVGVCVDRTLAMPVSVLAVMKAGGAYVPLDPTYPSDRLQFMMEDSKAEVLLTQSHLREIVPAGNARTVLIDREEWAQDGGTPILNPVEMTSDDLVYVIYTSGSTGKPKGVQIPHRALVNFLTSMAREPGMGREDRLLAVTTLSFDISGLELYLPLMLGAEVIIASRAKSLDPMQLADLIESSGATVVQATPATWRLLLKSGWGGSPGLRMLCGGEALERELAGQLLPMGAELWNLYGPTEATIWSSLLRVEEGTTSPVSIGRPIANTEMYILDEHGNPVPVGVAGELFIGGDGLARGYLNRPELTAERFIDHPFAPGSGRRVYRTGDGARFRRDGTIEFLGRLDTQVKVRGFRIELGEIESNLNGHSAIAESAVTVREDIPGDQRLVAYLVRSGDDEVASEELQAHLKTSLPDYMIPSSFVVLPSLPLTPNGKVDRRALPAPDGSGAGRRAFEAPETETERTIAQVWQDILRVEQVGLKDNFFDLGGHSLLAVRVQSLLADRLENPPSLIDLFQYPTVTALAQHVARSDEPSTSNTRTQDPASAQQEAGE
jgi:amino acid adenylation domain-containing protein